MALDLLLMLIIIGMVAGMLGALLGIGGGMLIVPAMTLVLGLTMQEAVAVSLVGIVATSSGATSHYVGVGLCNVRLAMVLEGVATLGSVMAATAAVLLDQSVLAAVFGLVMVYMAIYMVRRPERLSPPATVGGGHITGGYRDPVNGCLVEYQATHIGKGAVASFIAGNMSGLLGMGGGSVKVPVMNIIMGVPMRAAVGTSNLMVGVTALAGALVYYAGELIPAGIAAGVAVGVLLGSMTGARLSGKMDPRGLRTYFSLLLVAIGIMMLLKAVGVLS